MGFGIAIDDFLIHESSLQELKQVFSKERFVVLRSPRPREQEDLLRLARALGLVLKNGVEARFRVDDAGEIARVSDTGLFGDHDLEWHSDYAHSPGEFHGTLIYNHHGGELADLLVCDTHAAWEALDDEAKSRLARVHGLHAVSARAYRDYEPSAAERRLLRLKNFRIERSDYSHHCVHENPVARPMAIKDELGRIGLYLSPATLVGTEPKLSRDEIDPLIRHAERFVVTHRWRPHDIVLLDNRTTMHRRGPFRGTRVLYRIQFDPGRTP